MATRTHLTKVAGCSLVASFKKSGCNRPTTTLPMPILYCCNLILKYGIKVYSVYTHTHTHNTHILFCY